ncbi:CRISPR-associated endonuclease Cas3'' [Deinococcus aquaticus]|uniref:CRISPR-associated endonuclease Cas3'' n=1 Tax=Deinococcus aquaticus TaxID=328692 RepID=UPI003F446B6B
MTIPRYAAHSPGRAQSQWEDQRTHRERVLVALARTGVTTGLSVAQAALHDLGKYHPTFQAYIRASAAGHPAASAPHAFHGAVVAASLAQQWPDSHRVGHLGLALAAAPILAHHTGLHDHAQLRKALSDPLNMRAAGEAYQISQTDAHPTLAELRDLIVPPVGLDLFDGTQVDLMIRMLTSQLVDADWTATEQHYLPARAAQRGSPSLLDAAWRFTEGRRRFLARQLAGKARPPSAVVQQVREEVFQACVRAGQQAAASGQRVFRLTVPTGGGKTLSVTAFALALAGALARQSVRSQISRVIMAVPLTSITDQNADVLRQVLGQDMVLEHHSALDIRRRAEQPRHLQLATENWDAPVIVTTTVQAIEVLGAAEPRRLRKLHRLKGSVLILDEVQALPHHVLAPAIALLQEAAARHDVTVVLCSATQPPFELEERLDLTDAQEINTDFVRHFELLRRVTYHWLGELTPDTLTARLKEREQVLCVMNSRREAVQVLRALGADPGHFHLSTLMCGAHRREARQQMDIRLALGERVRLVSTTVIEAGVEISFPAAYRQTAGLERAQQVAGRTNRDGEGSGDVFLFDLQGGRDGQGAYGIATRIARELYRNLAQTLSAQGFSDALNDPQTTHRYFRDLLHDEAVDLDARQIQAARRQLNLRQVSDRFRLIDDDQVTVLVPYDRAAARLIAATRRKLARKGVLTSADRQRLQPYAVQVRPRDAERLEFTVIHEDLFTCAAEQYDPQFGLRLYDD